MPKRYRSLKMSLFSIIFIKFCQSLKSMSDKRLDATY